MKKNVNEMKSVGKELLEKKDLLNKCKTNANLLQILGSLNTKNLSNEATVYLNDLTTEIQSSSEKSFVKNFKHIYDVLLAGYGLKVIA